MSSSNTSGHILVVEDEEPTARLISVAFEEVPFLGSTHLVEDGRECLTVLRDQADGTYDPDIVLLDLDLPELDGFGVLDIRADDPALRQIPMLVFSGRNDPETIRQCYERGANAFISKPNDFHGYLSIAESIVEHWFETVDLPKSV